MRKNKLIALISSFLFFFTTLTSCGGAVNNADPIITFDGLGGSLITGESTTKVTVGTLWEDITKPIYTKDGTVSIFYTLVQDDITYMVPAQFPVCANLKVFAYYSDTPTINNQVIVTGSSIIPTSKGFSDNNFEPINFDLTYLKMPEAESKPTVICMPPGSAEATLDDTDVTKLTVTPKQNGIIVVIVTLDDDNPIVIFDGNGGVTSLGQTIVPVPLKEKSVAFEKISDKPTFTYGNRQFVGYSLTKDGKELIKDDFIIEQTTYVYAIFEDKDPYIIKTDGEHVTYAPTKTFNDRYVDEGISITIPFTLEEHYEYVSASGVDPNDAEITFDEEKGALIVVPKKKDYIHITIVTKLENISITFMGNGGKTASGDEKVIIPDVPYGTLFKDIKNKPTFYSEFDGQQQWYFSYDPSGEKHVNDYDEFTGDNTIIYAYYDTLNVTMLDNQILNYGSTVITYSSQKTDPVNIYTDALNDIKIEQYKTDDKNGYFVINSISNYGGSISLTISSGPISKSYSLGINHPKTQQQASESVDFALTQGLTNFSLTFDYNNTQTQDDFYKNSIETRMCLNGNPITSWYTGSGKTNTFAPNYNASMGTKRENIKETHPDYYYENIKNAAYEMRLEKINGTPHTLPIDSEPRVLTVHNSEGLFFALEHGYRPMFDGEELTSSVLAQNALQIYEKARQICANAYGNEASGEFYKVRQLYDWLVANTHNDNWIKTQIFTSESEKYSYSSYFADGVFLNNGIAVDDGFTKAFTILCGIEKLPVVRTTGSVVYEDEERTHAWNYYNYDGNDIWYLICPTWSHVDREDDSVYDFNYTLNSYQPFMRELKYFYNDSFDSGVCYFKETMKCSDSIARQYAAIYAKPYDYVEGLYNDLFKSTTDFGNIYDRDTFYYQGTTYSFELNSDSAAKALAEAIPESLRNQPFTINLPYSSGIQYYNALKEALENRFNVTAHQINNQYSGQDYSNAELHVLVKPN